MISLFSKLLLILSFAGTYPQWEVVYTGQSINKLRWWAVKCDGVTYAEYNTQEGASAAARELIGRRLGPYWYRRLPAAEVIATERAISEAAAGFKFNEVGK